MARIRSIVGVEKLKSLKHGKEQFVTHALLEDGSEVKGYGKDFRVGDIVEHFWHEAWGVEKIRKTTKGAPNHG